MSRALALCAVLGIVASAQAPARWRIAADRYLALLAGAETSGQRLEPAFTAIDPLREALMETRAAGQNNVLESLAAPEFVALQRSLRGVRINRDEIVFVEPDVDFFQKLALARGDQADRLFFQSLKATYPESIWPAYTEQQTDYSGCTRFAGGKLTTTYRRWSDFRRRFPGRYQTAASAQLEEVSEAISGSTCACEDGGVVRAGLQQFLRAFPSSSIGPRVTERLRQLQDGTSNIRLRCHSG